MQSTIIVDAEAIFEKSDWIGVNKKYRNVPPEVSDARNAALQVPELQSKHLFPSGKLPVTKLLEFKLPKIMNSVTGMKTKVWFSTDAPITNTECLYQALAHRHKVFRNAKAPRVDLLSGARITAHRNLVKGDYAIIIIDDELRVGQGIWKHSHSNIYLLRHI